MKRFLSVTLSAALLCGGLAVTRRFGRGRGQGTAHGHSGGKRVREWDGRAVRY